MFYLLLKPLSNHHVNLILLISVDYLDSEYDDCICFYIDSYQKNISSHVYDNEPISGD